MIYLKYYQSPIGRLTLASDGTNLIGLWMEGQKYYGSGLDLEHAVAVDEIERMDKTAAGGASVDGAAAGDSSVNCTVASGSAAGCGAVLDAAADWLDRYFAGKMPSPGELPLAPVGSSFRQEVWKLLCQIPYGQVTAYGELARKLTGTGEKTGSMSAQAVGGAVGHNPISIIIPCHRVVGTNGSLTGYAGGMEKKIRLLELEGTNMSRLFVPKKGTAL